MKRAAAFLFCLLAVVRYLDAQTFVFVTEQSNNTFTGVNAFNGPFQLGQGTNQIVFNGFGGSTTTVNVNAPAANRTLTVVDPGQNDTFLLELATQTVFNKSIDTANGNTFALGGVAFPTAFTGTGSWVLNNSPTLISPILGNAAATTIAIGGGTALGTTNQTGTGNLVLQNSPTLVSPVLGVAAATSLAIGGASPLATTNQTGTGSLVLNTSPTLVTPTLGVATATSVNLVAFTGPTTGSTIALQDGTTVTFQGTDTYVGRGTPDILTNKTLTAPSLTNPNLSAATLTGLTQAATVAENHVQTNLPTSPTCGFSTGGGTSPACSANSGSSDSNGALDLLTGSSFGGGSSSGSFIITFNAAFTTANTAHCHFFPLASTGSWNARVGFSESSSGLGFVVINWDNNSVNLSALTHYAVTYICWGQ
jgi:hypothetical protein